jgi:hypothetical protein
VTAATSPPEAAPAVSAPATAPAADAVVAASAAPAPAVAPAAVAAVDTAAFVPARSRSGSASLSSATTASADDIAAELGESFTAELPNSPNTEALLAGQPGLTAKELHAQLLAEQRARIGAPTELVSPCSSVSDASAAPNFHSPMSSDDAEDSDVEAMAGAADALHRHHNRSS